jgi:hypothetical protein
MNDIKIFIASALILSVAFAATAQVPAAAQTAPAQTVAQAPQFIKVASASKDFPDFNSKIWESAGTVSNFKVPPPREGGKATDPVQPTEVKLIHDGTNFYFKFTATDSEAAKMKVQEYVDDYYDEFPYADHMEIWMNVFGPKVFAFDVNGNKSTWQSYEKKYCHGFKVKTRRTDKGWEAVVAIPLADSFYNRNMQKTIGLSFVRNTDHGKDGVERSTSTGKIPSALANIPISE